MDVEESNVVQMRKKFEETLKSKELRINSFLIPSVEAYDKLIAEVEEAKFRTKKTCTDYRRLKRYDVLTLGESKKLVRPITKKTTNTKYYVHFDQLFDIIHATHLATNHGGKHKMENEIKTLYVNITRQVIRIYLQLCASCMKRNLRSKSAVAVVDSNDTEQKKECNPILNSVIEKTSHRADANSGTENASFVMLGWDAELFEYNDRITETAENSDTSEEQDESGSQNQKLHVDISSKRPLILINRKRPANGNILEQVNIPLKKRETDQESREDSRINRIYTTPIQKSKEYNDEDAYIFGMGVAAKVKKLNNERLKIRVQRDIDMLLYDAIMETGRYSMIEEEDIKKESFDETEKHTGEISNQADSFDEFDIKIEEAEII